MPDSFVGFMAGGQLDRPELENLLAHLDAGVTELMVHVGLSDNDPFGLRYSWYSADFLAVTSRRKADVQAASRVEIRSYANAWK
jgi:hypothetical protein